MRHHHAQLIGLCSFRQVKACDEQLSFLINVLHTKKVVLVFRFERFANQQSDREVLKRKQFCRDQLRQGGSVMAFMLPNAYR